MATETEESAVKRPRPLWSALIIATVLIILPGLFLGPIFFSPVILWALSALALSFRKKYVSIRKQRLRNLGIYVVAVIVVIVNYSHGFAVAQDRGQVLVSAIKAFHDAHQHFPDRLEELVPKYIDRVPPAMYGRFYYFNSAEAGPTFFYVTLPPFGRRAYCFAEKPKPCIGQNPFDEKKNAWYDFD